MTQEQELQASFATLILSIASSAAMAMGLAPNPMTNKTEKDVKMAKFNIDLLKVLQEKTKSNLSKEETMLLESMIHDLQIKFVKN
jgi:hypothetical protein